MVIIRSYVKTCKRTLGKDQPGLGEGLMSGQDWKLILVRLLIDDCLELCEDFQKGFTKFGYRIGL